MRGTRSIHARRDAGRTLSHAAPARPCAQDWTGEADLSDALLATAHRLPRARFIITTLGKQGAVLLERPGPPGSASSSGDSAGSASGSSGSDSDSSGSSSSGSSSSGSDSSSSGDDMGEGGEQGRPLQEVMEELKRQLQVGLWVLWGAL